MKYYALVRCNHCVLTFPVMTIQPSWSTMSTSSCDGGWQNFCWRICKMCSMTFGVSLKATAIWPSARMLWSGIRWASLAERQVIVLKLFNRVIWPWDIFCDRTFFLSTRKAAHFSFSCEMYRRLERLAKKASTITWSIVKPAFKHLTEESTRITIKNTFFFF